MMYVYVCLSVVGNTTVNWCQHWKNITSTFSENLTQTLHSTYLDGGQRLLTQEEIHMRD